MADEMKNIFEHAPHRRAERRRGLDKRGKIGLGLSAAGWMFWGVGMYITYFAFPQFFTYFDLKYNKSPDYSWKPGFLYISELLWAAGAVLCILSLYQFRKRYKRRTDKTHFGILTALVFNIASMLGYGIFIILNGF